MHCGHGRHGPLSWRQPCIPVVVNQTIDDLVIFAYVKPIDGARGILGFATPHLQPRLGQHDDLRLHDVRRGGHGELAAAGRSRRRSPMRWATCSGSGRCGTTREGGRHLCQRQPTSKPYFTGGSARQAFQGALGAGVVWSDSMVPLEGTGTCFNGTRDAHPSEAIFKNELMTGYIDQFSNPLSAVSASFLRDLGMTVNDLATDRLHRTVRPPDRAHDGGRGKEVERDDGRRADPHARSQWPHDEDHRALGTAKTYKREGRRRAAPPLCSGAWNVAAIRLLHNDFGPNLSVDYDCTYAYCWPAPVSGLRRAEPQATCVQSQKSLPKTGVS